MSRHAMRIHHPQQAHPHRYLQHHPGVAQALARTNPGQIGPTKYGHPGMPGIMSYEQMKENYSVTNDMWEVITTSLYDSAPYAAAGVNQITFFQNGIGQGTGFGGAAKTLSDTNMISNGLLPNGISFLVQEIEIEIQPTTPTVAAQMPAVFGAQAAAQIVNDAYIIGRSGSLTFNILAKPYLTEAPVGQFVSRYDFDISGALADVSTTGGAMQSRALYGKWIGDRYRLSPVDLRLAETMNFTVVLKWEEGLQAIQNPARIFCRLRGLEYRRSQ